MDNCSCCGNSIPEGQGVCSMCYGDPSFGQDGYYQRMLEMEEQMRENELHQRMLEAEEDEYYQKMIEIEELIKLEKDNI